MRTERVAATCIGVVKIYWTATGEVHALKGADALFPTATLTAIVGPSGSGKTSLLRILAGLDRPTAGSVTVGNVEVSALSHIALHRFRRRLVGYVFQRPSDNLIPYLNVNQHLEQAISLKGARRSRDDIPMLLEALGLAGRQQHLPQQLSGGEQQRVAIAQAAAGEPKLLIADEPTAELDSDSGHAVIEALTGLTDKGMAVVVSTHDNEVVKAADRTLFLRHGTVEAEAEQSRMLSVIDASGRIQLPPSALRLFPNHRAVLEITNEEIRIVPP